IERAVAGIHERHGTDVLSEAAAAGRHSICVRDLPGGAAVYGAADAQSMEKLEPGLRIDDTGEVVEGVVQVVALDPRVPHGSDCVLVSRVAEGARGLRGDDRRTESPAPVRRLGHPYFQCGEPTWRQAQRKSRVVHGAGSVACEPWVPKVDAAGFVRDHAAIGERLPAVMREGKPAQVGGLCKEGKRVL